jgi:hypothetical protein
LLFLFLAQDIAHTDASYEALRRIGTLVPV